MIANYDFDGIVSPKELQTAEIGKKKISLYRQLEKLCLNLIFYFISDFFNYIMTYQMIVSVVLKLELATVW